MRPSYKTEIILVQDSEFSKYEEKIDMSATDLERELNHIPQNARGHQKKILFWNLVEAKWKAHTQWAPLMFFLKICMILNSHLIYIL